MSLKKRIILTLLAWIPTLVVLWFAVHAVTDLQPGYKNPEHGNTEALIPIALWWMLALPVVAMVVRSTWTCFYQPYYRWRYHGKNPALQLNDDDCRLAGNPEFPDNKHVPYQSLREASGAGDAFKTNHKKPGN